MQRPDVAMVRMRLDAEAAPSAGGIQQGAARLPLARWPDVVRLGSGRSTEHILRVARSWAGKARCITVAAIPRSQGQGSGIRTWTPQAREHVPIPIVEETSHHFGHGLFVGAVQSCAKNNAAKKLYLWFARTGRHKQVLRFETPQIDVPYE